MAESAARFSVGRERALSDELLEVKPKFMGFQLSGYFGAFPPVVERQIRMLAESPCLHLFSGRSTIGDVRVDFERPEATVNQDVFEFIKNDGEYWKFVIADPPYESKDPRPTKDYAKPKSVSGDVWNQSAMGKYLRAHPENVLWFDYVSPCPEGFYRHKTFLYLPGGWKKTRVLTWLKRKGERLDGAAAGEN